MFPACLAPFFGSAASNSNKDDEGSSSPALNRLPVYLLISAQILSRQCRLPRAAPIKTHAVLCPGRVRGPGDRSGGEREQGNTKRERGGEFPSLKRHVGPLLLKSQSHQMMCSLCRPPSRLLFSLLFCFQSRDFADCTASTIQRPQTKSICRDREGAAQAAEAQGLSTPELCRPLGVKAYGGAGLGSSTLRFPLQPRAFRLNLGSDSEV